MKLRTWCIRIGHFLTKTGLGVRAALLLMLVCCFAFVSVSHAEIDTQGITIRQQNVTLEKVFQAIEKQSGYRFFYNESLLEGAGKVTLDLRNVSLQEALEACFRNQPFTYKIVEKTIIIKRKEGVAASRTVAAAPITKIIAVRGKVTSGDKPVVGATVTVKGTDNATSTDNEGVFTLSEVDDQGILVISHVSHQTQEVGLEGKTFISVDLNAKVNDLDEAVVVAYNTTTQKRNTGSVTVVKGEQITSLPNRSVDKSLQGLVPGLLVTSGNGQPGSGLSNFILRGIATAGSPFDGGSTTRNPLIVVDGVPVTQDHSQWVTVASAPVSNPLAQLNPSDVESITILKDAAAIALYGSKASNGVILITTKKGKAGKTIFSIRQQTDIASRLDGKIKLLNEDEYYELLYETYRNTNPTTWTDNAILTDLKSKFTTKSDGSLYYEPDWRDIIFDKNATTVSNEFSASGGNEKSNFYLNFEYTKQNGVVKKTGYDRKSLRFNFENRPANWFKIGINTTLSYNVQNYASLTEGSPVGLSFVMSPLNPPYLEDGSLVLNYKYPYDAANPIAIQQYNFKRNVSYRGLSKAYGELSFFKNFKFTSSIGVDYTQVEAKEKIDPRLFDDYYYSVGTGRIQERETRNANLITTNTLRFDKIFKNVHAVNVLLGQEAQILSSKYLMVTGRGLQIPGYDQISLTTTKTADGMPSKETLLSYFGQVNYGYNSKYFLTASIRTDGSSRFGENNQYGTYWSTGLGWIPTAEPFMMGASSWLNFLKIRGSIGAAGNSFAINRNTRYDILINGIYLNNLAIQPYREPSNPNVQWEQTFSWDVGIESRFWKDRIRFTADLYQRKTSDMIYSVALPFVTGYASVIDNIGNIDNRGVELVLAADIVRTRDFQWNINANWSTNKNKLIKANVPLVAILGNTLANEEGRNFNSFYMPIWAGVNPADGMSQWIDADGKPTSNYTVAKKEFVGKPQPDGFGAVTNTFSYKNFDLSTIFYYQYGFQIYNSNSLNNDGAYPYANQDKTALDRWQKVGDIAKNPKRTLNNNASFNTSTRYLFDGDFIRLQNVLLAYQFPKRVINQLRLSMLRVYAQAYNVALWSKFPGEDNGTTAGGGTGSAYPNLRTFSLGVNLNF